MLELDSFDVGGIIELRDGGKPAVHSCADELYIKFKSGCNQPIRVLDVFKNEILSTDSEPVILHIRGGWEREDFKEALQKIVRAIEDAENSEAKVTRFTC